MEEHLIVFAESKAPWILTVGAVFFVAILTLGSSVESTLVSDGMLAPVMDTYRQGFHEHYGKVALSVLGSAIAGSWKAYKRKRRQLFGY